ncbi:uncharacterized protein BO97DRAFT_454023 [Aspergillus homomorphus CBS 101889]|uniref:Uncharacterized protein n=1 Tax=Aspergillus homomorphus (strain CBS 101889) TaxID=1450537 RepID=A0A395HUK0_ASPHC|nr:hypothetical protein BO97DRAFT_454023 [Aspergillus homomorphus CBS 101889]RAL11497.1 hypothetical protein BO97DRAFT_454023 [Aspergillus homomorphus CBS 101889]
MITENKVEVQINGQWPLGESYQYLNEDIHLLLTPLVRPRRAHRSAPRPQQLHQRLLPRNQHHQQPSHSIPLHRRRLPHARPIKPIFLFLADDANHTPGETITTAPKPDTCLNCLLGQCSDGDPKAPPGRPAGLPFGVGRHGWARRSDGTRMGDSFLGGEDPADENYDLYQWMVNGFIPFRDVPVHRVLDSWAERVRAGDWVVGRDGVADGVQRWREADSDGVWAKYWVFLGW